MFFRLCAFGLTGIICSLVVIILTLIFGSIFIGYILPILIKDESLLSNTIVWDYLFSFSITTVAWFIIFPMPLKKNGQTFGMKCFGLKFYHPEQEQLSWKTVILREVSLIISGTIVIGIFGSIWALFDKKERSVFDKISGIYVLKGKAKLKFVGEFREYREQIIMEPKKL